MSYLEKHARITLSVQLAGHSKPYYQAADYTCGNHFIDTTVRIIVHNQTELK